MIKNYKIRKNKKKNKKNEIILIIFIIIIITILIKDIAIYSKMKNKYNNIKKRIETLKKENKILEKKIKNVYNDREYIERIAREELNLVKEGEIVYIIKKDK